MGTQDRLVAPPRKAARRELSRRQLLRRMLATQQNSPQPASVGSDRILFLVNRLTQGFTRAEYELAQSLGYQGYLEYQLDYQAIDDSALDQRIAQYSTLTLSAKELYDQYHNGEGVPIAELKAATVLRSIYSKRQLFERMVEFWSDHFAMDHLKDDTKLLKTVDDREVIRQHALGKFPDLLRASAHSGAMLFFLDNHSNTKLGPQENYARELMELHTLGVTGPYTEADVKEVARCLTGWTIHVPSNPQYGEFRFLLSQHDQGAKTVLGVPIPPNGGQSDGDTVLDILVQHPATAQFIATKMIRWLWSPEPSPGMVDRVAATYLATGGDIREMIRTIFTSGPFESEETAARPKFRRPFHLATSLVRALELDVVDVIPLYIQMLFMGHLPFGWPTPDGYPDTLRDWGSNMLPRWNFSTRLIDDQLNGTSAPGAHLTQLLDATGASTLSEKINLALAGGGLAPAEVAILQTYADSFGNQTMQVVRETLALAAATPSFQFH